MSQELCPKKFQETFDAYFRKWWIAVGVCYVPAFSLFFVPLLVRATESELPSFVRSIVNFGSYPGLGEVTLGFITIGIISVGAVAVGVIAIGACSVGVFALGGGFRRHLRLRCVFCWYLRVWQQRFWASRCGRGFALWRNR